MNFSKYLFCLLIIAITIYSNANNSPHLTLPKNYNAILLIQDEIDIENDYKILKSDTLFKGINDQFYINITNCTNSFSNGLALKMKCGEDFYTVRLEIIYNEIKKYSIDLEREVCVGGRVKIGQSKIEPTYIHFHRKCYVIVSNNELVSFLTNFYWECYNNYFNKNEEKNLIKEPPPENK